MNLFRSLKQHKGSLINLIAASYIMVMLPFYALREPARMDQVEVELMAKNIDSAMTIYAENCALCHGMAGEGISSNPALNDPSLAQMEYDSLNRTIAYGLYNTSMPAWSQEAGGALTDYQISQLTALMQNDWWEFVQDRVVNLGMQPLIPVASQPDADLLAQVATMPGGEVLSQGISLYSEQCVSCHGPDGLGSSIASALNDPALRAQPQADIEKTITSGVSGTLMAGWKNILTSDEVTALSTLILQWDTIPAGTIPAPEKTLHVTAESLQLGQGLYAASCSRCHGADGEGTPRAPSLNVKSFLEETNDMAVQHIISLGVPGTSMLAWETRMSEAEIQAIVGFIRSWEPTAPEVAVPSRGPGGGGQWQSPSPGSTQKGPPWLRNGYPNEQVP